MDTPAGAKPMKPQPRVNALTRPFWDGANARTLVIQRCTAAGCGRAVFYPRVCCPYCKGAGLEWVRAAGTGRIVSHTTVRRTHHEGFDADAPYVFAAIELDEGACMYAQVPGAPIDGASMVGAPVRVDFVEHGPGRLMPVFRLVAPPRSPS